MSNSVDRKKLIEQTKAARRRGRKSGGDIGDIIGITERKPAQDELWESERRYHDLYDNAPDMFASVDARTGIILACNRTLTLATGYTKEEIVGRHVSEIYHPDCEQARERAFQQFVTSGEVQGEELSLRRKDGTRIEVSLSASAVRDEQGNILHSRSVLRDITERKQAEQALRESEKRFRDIFENSVIGMYRTTHDGRILMANTALVRMLGFASFEELAERNLEQEGFEPNYPRSEFKRRMNTEGRVIGLESRWTRRDNTVLFVRESARVIRDDQGNVLGYEGTVEDVTERKRVEDALRASEEKYRFLFDAVPVGIGIADFDGNALDCNKAMQQTMGYTLAELGSMNLRETYVNPDDRMELVEELRRSGRVRDWQVAKRGRDGSTRYALVNADAVERDGKNVILSTIRDITERKNMEDKLRQEARMRNTLLDNLPCVAMILRKGTREIVISNKVAESVGAVPGVTCYGTCAERDAPCPFCLAPEVWETDEPRRLEVKYRGKDYVGIWVPLNEDLYVHYVFDITDRKRAEQQVLEDRAQLKSLASQLSRMEERERHRLATVLHDRIGQSLVFSKLKLDELRTADPSGELDKALDEVSSRLGQVIQETRTLTFDLSSPILYELGFEAAVAEWLADEIRDKHGIETEFDDDGRRKPLSDDIRATLFRNVRELLFNVVKHAHARKVKVCIRGTDESVSVSVEDDGVGFDPVGARAMAAKSDRFGLFSIRERLEQLGGLIEIDSEPGRGTRILMKAPLKCEQLRDGSVL